MGDNHWDPTPHPNTAARTSSRNRCGPKGPIGLILQAAHLIGATFNQRWEILTRNEIPLQVLGTPFQALAKMALQRATQARCRADAGRINKWDTMVEVDNDVLHNLKKKIDKYAQK